MSFHNDLSFATLRAANEQRLPLFKNRLGGPAHSMPDGSDWSPADWMVAVMGELGEACGFMKGMKRGDFGPVDSETYADALRSLAKEFADTITYLDLAAKQYGFDLGEEVSEKFNEVSDRVAAPVYIWDNDWHTSPF